MWIQLELNMEMPVVFGRKPRRARRVKAIMPTSPVWTQIDVPTALVELSQYRPGLLKRAWNWIKAKVAKWTSI